MGYIKTAVCEIDIEEIDEVLNRESVNINELVGIYNRHETVYDFWFTTYGLEHINMWMDEHGEPNLEECVECMAYVMKKFVEWIKTLN